MYATVIPTLSLYRLRGIVLKPSELGVKDSRLAPVLIILIDPVGELPASKEWFSIA